ncbi:recombinase family protein [Streptomyces sp. NPDC002671]
MYDPSGPGRLLFAFFAAMAETERENIRESTLEGLDAAARKGKHGSRPPVITDDMLRTVLRRRTNGESVEQSQPDLIIPTGKRKGQAPSAASTAGPDALPRLAVVFEGADAVLRQPARHWERLGQGRPEVVPGCRCATRRPGPLGNSSGPSSRPAPPRAGWIRSLRRAR